MSSQSDQLSKWALSVQQLEDGAVHLVEMLELAAAPKSRGLGARTAASLRPPETQDPTNTRQGVLGRTQPDKRTDAVPGASQRKASSERKCRPLR